MKKTAYFFVFIMLFIFTITALPVSASIDDFDIDYSITPEVVGYKGADIQVRIKVHNEGSADITGIRVGVTTMAGYSQDRVGTIAPGTSTPWLLFVVPFDSEDLGIDKLLTVAIENDGDGDYRDGTQVRTFRVEGTHDIFEVTSSKSPDHGYYLVGETVTVTYSFCNTFTEHAATNADALINFTYGEPADTITATDSYGIIMPGETVSISMLHTFTESDIGTCHVSYNLNYKMMGYDYTEAATTFLLDVRSPEPDIDFNCLLTTDKTEIEAGEEVAFTVAMENMGSDSLSFEVRDSEGGLVVSTEALRTGESGYVTTFAHIYETTDISYVVIGYAGTYNESKETNVVRITVVEPEESPTPTPTDEVTPDPTEEATPDPTEEATPDPTEESTSTAIVSPAPKEAFQQTPQPTIYEIETAQKNDNNGSSIWLYVILVVLGLLLVAAIVAIPLLIRRYNGGNKTDRRDEEL